ncbi:MAG: polysaccharide biosynthesis protein [Clostridiales bacterium]|nr:polysaccharide biosynthesis protein [Clostridiales bacterium]
MKKKIFSNSSLISGTLILTVTGIISRCIGFYYKIFLSREIGADGLGMYQLIFPIFALFLAVSSAGIQTAVSRFCASCQSDREANGYLAAGLSVTLTLSVLCMLLIRGNADWFCQIMMEGMDAADLLRIMTWAIPFASVHSCISGYYFGRKKAMVPAFSQIFEQTIRVGSVWMLMQIASVQGRTPSVSDAVWGILIGEVGAVLYCVTAVCFSGMRDNHRLLQGSKPKPGRRSPYGKHTQTIQKATEAARQQTESLSLRRSPRSLFKYYRNLLSLAIPLTANRLISSLSASAESLLIPYSLRLFGYTGTDALSVYGILTGMVFSTIMFPAVISNSLSVMLLPSISGALAQGNLSLIRRAVQRTVELCIVLGFLCTFGFLLGGGWIGSHLFGNTLAGVYLKTLCWICPFIFLGSTLGSVLHGLGRAGATLAINLFASLIRIAFICLGIPIIGLKAYLWAMLISQVFTAVASLLCIRNTDGTSSAPHRQTDPLL